MYVKNNKWQSEPQFVPTMCDISLSVSFRSIRRLSLLSKDKGEPLSLWFSFVIRLTTYLAPVAPNGLTAAVSRCSAD